MADYKLTKTAESQGDRHFYRIERIDKGPRIMVSWDYEKIEKIVEKMEVGEEHILHV